jgi:hypothetical protein
VQPQHPNPHDPGPTPPTQPPHHSAADITTTVILSVLAGLAAVGAVSFSFFFVMATDSCGPQHCNYDALNAAYVVTWGGIGLAVVLGAAGIIAAAVRKTRMWIWPAVALGMIVVAAGIGMALANSVMHHG